MPEQIKKLTKAQIEQFSAWVDKWVAVGLSTEPADFDAATAAALKCYEFAGLNPPQIVLRLSSPYAACLGGLFGLNLLQRNQVEGQVRSQVRSQVWDQVGGQVWSQVESQVKSQVGDQVWSQVESQVGDQVWSQVWDQVGGQVEGQVESQVWDQVGGQVEGQVGDQVWSQVESQVKSQVGGQVWSQVRDQVEGQVGDQVWSQVKSQVGGQVESQVRSQVWGQVWGQVESQVGSQVRSQVGSQVWGQVGSQVESQVGGQVWSQVRDQVWSQVGDQVWSQVFQNLYHGSFWASWGAYISFLRDICGWENSVLARFAVEEQLIKSCGYVWWHEDVLVISDRPSEIRRDQDGRLHCETGPALTYRDGWCLWNWHGTAIPKEWITEKKSLTAATVLKTVNVEQRRAGCEILGWSRILNELQARTLDRDPDPEIGELVEVMLPDLAVPAKFLRVRCGTGREFAIGIPPHINKALDAQAWMVGLDPKEFTQPEVRT